MTGGLSPGDEMCAASMRRHFWQRGFGYRELADDSEGVAWYIRTQKRRLSRYER